MLIKIKDQPHLARSGAAIVSTDNVAYENALKRRQSEKHKKTESSLILQMDTRMSDIEDKMDAILKLLQGKLS